MYPNFIDLELAGLSMKMSSYRFFVVLSLLYLLFFSWRKLDAAFPASKDRLWFLFLEVGAFFIGSRLLYGVLYVSEVLNDPWLLFRFQLSYFSLFGGLALSLALWFLVSKKRRLSFFSLLDILAPPIGITLALMKLGCFFNGCCYGTGTSLPWGVTFPVESSLHGWSESLKLFGIIPPKVHPAQLYEVGAALLAGGIAWVMLRKKSKEGLAAISFGLSYTAFRWLIFYFRAFPRASDLSNFIRGPIVYGVALVFFTLALIRLKKNGDGSHLL